MKSSLSLEQNRNEISAPGFRQAFSRMNLSLKRGLP